jgi:diphthamide biosynthesis enzyme Dph1/Dph2-like protein
MKVLFIESKLKDLELNLDSNEISKLPKKIFLAYSIQYKDLAIKLKELLQKNKIKVSNFKQVLGCSIVKCKDPVLLVGSGKFHAINLYLQVPKVFILEGNKISQTDSSEIEKLKNKRKAALLKFLSGKNIGILVSYKPGQKNFNLALKIKKYLIKKGKNAYIFIGNNINVNEFENFNIDSWVNTACMGLSLDNPNIINYRELASVLDRKNSVSNPVLL